jgi:hypothetical protein
VGTKPSVRKRLEAERHVELPALPRLRSNGERPRAVDRDLGVDRARDERLDHLEHAGRDPRLDQLERPSPSRSITTLPVSPPSVRNS